MEIRELNPKQKATWNKYITSSKKGNPLQTYEWGELKKEWGWKPYRIAVWNNFNLTGALSLLERTYKGFTFFYSPRGPILENNNPQVWKALTRYVQKKAWKRNAVFWRMDPEISQGPPLKNINLVLAPINSPFEGIQPRRVWRIPVYNDPEKQWNNLRKSARRQIKNAQKNGIEIETDSKDIGKFYKLLKFTAQKNNFQLRPYSYFESLQAQMKPKIMFAYKNGRPISSALAIKTNKGVWDLYAGNDPQAFKYGACYYLTWKLIIWAGKIGAEFYDLGGIINPSIQNHPLSGLHQFKSRFGGKEQNFWGCYDLVFRPALYFPYSFGSRVWSKIKKFSQTDILI